VKLSYGFAIVLEIILLGLRSVVPQALSRVGAGCSARWATSAGRFAQKVGLTTSSEPRYESATTRSSGFCGGVSGKRYTVPGDGAVPTGSEHCTSGASFGSNVDREGGRRSYGNALARNSMSLAGCNQASECCPQSSIRSVAWRSAGRFQAEQRRLWIACEPVNRTRDQSCTYFLQMNSLPIPEIISRSFLFSRRRAVQSVSPPSTTG
jgi:hypothetical protein